jgi:hypothetical protein
MWVTSISWKLITNTAIRTSSALVNFTRRWRERERSKGIKIYFLIIRRICCLHKRVGGFIIMRLTSVSSASRDTRGRPHG